MRFVILTSALLGHGYDKLMSRGYFYCQSVGRGNRAMTLLAEACQLVHLLGLHDDITTSTKGLDCIELEIARRVFWHVYAVDM
jgi:hypothetical protein